MKNKVFVFGGNIGMRQTILQRDFDIDGGQDFHSKNYTVEQRSTFCG